jgi:hypothetical protein
MKPQLLLTPNPPITQFQSHQKKIFITKNCITGRAGALLGGQTPQTFHSIYKWFDPDVVRIFFWSPLPFPKNYPFPCFTQKVFCHSWRPGMSAIFQTTSDEFNNFQPFIQYMTLYLNPPRNPPEFESKVKILKITLFHKSEIYGGGA